MKRCSHAPGRTLHVIDVENLVGGTAAGTAAVRPALVNYRGSVVVRADDHVLLGSGPTLAMAAGLAWPGAQLKLGHGIDGADNALLGALDPDYVAKHYDRVVLASGDHAFAGLVSALRARCVAVLVVTRDRESLSIDLRRQTMHRTLALAS
jgi:hypothetical protein